jgi:peroxiredoxin
VKCSAVYVWIQHNTKHDKITSFSFHSRHASFQSGFFESLSNLYRKLSSVYRLGISAQPETCRHRIRNASDLPFRSLADQNHHGFGSCLGISAQPETCRHRIRNASDLPFRSLADQNHHGFGSCCRLVIHWRAVFDATQSDLKFDESKKSPPDFTAIPLSDCTANIC